MCERESDCHVCGVVYVYARDSVCVFVKSVMVSFLGNIILFFLC